MPSDAQDAPLTSPEILAGRRESAGRIEGYGSIDNLGGRNGAIVREVGRVAEVDLGFALEIVRDFEPDLKIKALTIIGKNSGELGPLSDAREHAEAEDLESAAKSRKLASIAKVAADIDVQFAFDTVRAIPHDGQKVDTLLEVAERSMLVDKLNKMRADRMAEDPEDINFSTELLIEMVREADRIMETNSRIDDFSRNNILAKVSAGHDLGVTYRANKRKIEFRNWHSTRDIDSDAFALQSVQSYIREYIRSDDFEGLEQADPGGEVTVAAFKAAVSEHDGELEKLAARLGLDNEFLDPVVDAVDLLRDLQRRKSITFQNPNPRLYRELLAVIHDGAEAQLVEFDLAEERRKAAEEAAPAFDSWED